MGYPVSLSVLRVNMIALALVIVLPLSQQAWVNSSFTLEDNCIKRSQCLSWFMISFSLLKLVEKCEQTSPTLTLYQWECEFTNT